MPQQRLAIDGFPVYATLTCQLDRRHAAQLAPIQNLEAAITLPGFIPFVIYYMKQPSHLDDCWSSAR